MDKDKGKERCQDEEDEATPLALGANMFRMVLLWHSEGL